jgi:hypothetical protein
MSIEQLSTASGAVMEGPLLITPQVFGDAGQTAAGDPTDSH